METVLMTLPAHFDGARIQIDVDVELKPDTRLLVTVLDETLSSEALVWNAMRLSEATFARVWDNEEDAVYDNLWAGRRASRSVPVHQILGADTTAFRRGEEAAPP